MTAPVGNYAAWLGLVAYVTAADVMLDRHRLPLLSTTARAAVAHPRSRWPVVAAWALLTVHLASARHDPWAAVTRFRR